MKTGFFFFLLSVFLVRDFLEFIVSFLYRLVSKGFLLLPFIEKRWDFRLFNLLMFFCITAILFAPPTYFFVKTYVEYQVAVLSSEFPEPVYLTDFLRYLLNFK